MNANIKKNLVLLIQILSSEIVILLLYYALGYPIVPLIFVPPIVIVLLSHLFMLNKTEKKLVSLSQYFLSIVIELLLFFIALLIVVVVIDYLKWFSFAHIFISMYITYFLNKNVSFKPLSFSIMKCDIPHSLKLLVNNGIYILLFTFSVFNKPFLLIAIGIFLSVNILCLLLKRQTLIMIILNIKKLA